ncbi:protein O-GlcNAcase [Alphaproteobacteria bacterium]|nr:protein O-GlcNAcase [Alphaproteobacteria bacterium]
MQNKKINYTIGYIEGYYGQILSWTNRKLIVKSLQKNKMNTYFYAPKEDENHRLNWRKKYSPAWRKEFKSFTNFSKKKSINIIAGIAPGLDFDFKTINVTAKKTKNSDFNLLYNKAKQLLNDGATAIALLLDDIPDNFNENNGYGLSEGTSHGILANKLSKKLGHTIYFVPRIYADELIKDEPKYLNDLSRVLDAKIKLFYCGKNVVAKNLCHYSKIKKLFSNQIIFWDNYYANDYCPRRFFIGPYKGRKGLNNIMINSTGLIKTDLLILDIVNNTIEEKNSFSKWLFTIENHGVPPIFNKIKIFFLEPNFGSNSSSNFVNFNSKYIEVLDFLLWKWKSELSREWYPFLFGLKQDLQINQNKLTSERTIKTQTIPLSEHLNKGEL